MINTSLVRDIYKESDDDNNKKRKRCGKESNGNIELSTATLEGQFEYEKISLDQTNELLLKNLNTPIPEGHLMFPWLHMTETSYDADATQQEQEEQQNPINSGECNDFIENNITIIRSGPYGMFDAHNEPEYIENSGILFNSVDARDLFMPLGIFKEELYSIIESEQTLLSMEIFETETSFHDLYDYCLKSNILPILNIDDVGQCQYGLKKKNLKHNRVRSSSINSCNKEHEPKMSRRFDIQAGKNLQLSSKIVVYCFNQGDENTHCFCETVLKLLRMSLELNFQRSGYKFQNIERSYHLVNIPHPQTVQHALIGTPLMESKTLFKEKTQLVSKFDATILNNWEKDLYYREKLEVSKISSASPIDSTETVWCGNSIDCELFKMFKESGNTHNHKKNFYYYYDLENSICNISNLKVDDYMANDKLLFNLPPVQWKYFVSCDDCLQKDSHTSKNNQGIMNDEIYDYFMEKHLKNEPPNKQLSFPASGLIGLGSLSLLTIKMIFQFIDLIHQLSLPAGVSSQSGGGGGGDGANVLIYSADGYTETSFLTVAYTIYSQNLTMEDAIIYLHTVQKRPFFLFPSDLQVLFYLQNLLLDKSPKNPNRCTSKEITNEEFTKMFFSTDISKNKLMTLKGPLPSRILEYMYLGSLKHAENYELLKKLGINCIISVGERLNWINSYKTGNHTSESEIIETNGFTIYHIDNIADNGKDPLIHSFNSILSFIEKQRQMGNKILIHCMVGVSRSATVVIAEVMKSLNLDLIKAYTFVRVRRLNIIIQPNLMFMYELLKFEELLNRDPLKKRSINWHILCKAINELNGNYIA